MSPECNPADYRHKLNVPGELIQLCFYIYHSVLCHIISSPDISRDIAKAMHHCRIQYQAIFRFLVVLRSDRCNSIILRILKKKCRIPVQILPVPIHRFGNKSNIPCKSVQFQSTTGYRSVFARTRKNDIMLGCPRHSKACSRK